MTSGYRIVIEKRAERELLALDGSVRRRIELAIAALSAEPRPAGCRKLVGATPNWRIRVGDYRVIYQVRDDLLLVLVMRAGHRRDIYR